MRVLGKLIGVYWASVRGLDPRAHHGRAGRDQLLRPRAAGKPLIVTDDDISGTFTFLRALADYDYRPDLSPAQIGQTWLNYLIEKRAILWWGGMGNSTEHTAFLRLKRASRRRAAARSR